jgi:hypothetical protein
MIRTALIAFCVLLISACATPSNEALPLEPLKPAPDGRVNLVLHRDAFYLSLITATIRLNGVEIGKLRNNRSLRYSVAPGEYELMVDWPLLSGESDMMQKVVVPDEGVLKLELTEEFRN